MTAWMDDDEKVKVMFQEIADLKVRMKEMDADLKTKEAIAFAFMDRRKVDKIETGFGNFTRVFYPVWKFSPAVIGLETEVKELKAREKEEGVATISTNRAQLRYTIKKDKE